MATTGNLCAVEKRGRVHVITLTGAGEHRLSPALLSAIRSAVAATRRASTGSAGVLVLAAEGKFFSNGYDLPRARAGPAPAPGDRVSTMRAALRGLVADLLALLVPTVAAVTGHAGGAGCALALAHDAVVMRASRGFLYMSEVDAGIKIVDFGELVRHKVPDSVTRRDLVMKGEKMTAAEAVRRGIIDAAVDGGVEDVVARAVAMAEELAGRGWDRLLAYHAALYGLVADLLALPVPTVAAVTGHAVGAGCALALAHDAIVMRASRGFLYMSEVDAGIKIDFVGEVLRQKVPDEVARRDLVMKGDKMTAAEAVRRGIVDAAVDGGVEDVVAAAVAMAEELAGRSWDGENLANIRKATWPVLWSKVKDYGGEAAAHPRL